MELVFLVLHCASASSTAVRTSGSGPAATGARLDVAAGAAGLTGVELCVICCVAVVTVSDPAGTIAERPVNPVATLDSMRLRSEQSD